MKIFIISLVGLINFVWGIPLAKSEDKEINVEAKIPPLLTFKDGNIGVNFLGFKASAGLGGLLNGDRTQGGLHAEAETPFGQKAGAGLGGHVDGQGRSLGGLYAGATAGGGVGARAGLNGAIDEHGSIGRSYASASSGGVGKTVLKERISGRVSNQDENIQKIPIEEDSSPPESRSRSKIHIDFSEPHLDGGTKTYVEKTVIPNYVEKTIQVPTIVEKTIQVPGYIEKTVQVPVAPTIIEKEISSPVPADSREIKTRRKLRKHHPWLLRRRLINTEAPYYGGVSAAETVEAINLQPSSTYTQTATIRKEYNGNLIRDVFNIPIATLGAVSNLVGNIAGGTSGTLSVNKNLYIN